MNELNDLFVYRSLTIKHTSGHSDETTKSLVNILHHLAEDRFLESNRILTLRELDWSHNDQFIQVICSMKKLERLDLWDCELTIDNHISVFLSCPKLVELRIKTIGSHRNPTSKKRKCKDDSNELMLGLKRLTVHDIRVLEEMER
jgi:hypothetical protein